ncbi:bifunctional alpha/beta hydrolase/OsmC family protein [Parvularcula maris]|uniref:Bifunctional alpha/beta hydrolase/OsmC family protein n=1 Tax=Parvularcula maris TaxID=2965077 RepID=A0A9X2RKM5_9PROT|nr:bifunctional alpha/beta hydrolase/OsmC family protein [Parvularcula maris]MCQ8185747.1 bifunctional alpha/beta hydrolase/OsmC family protein [Parvularcula maris]
MANGTKTTFKGASGAELAARLDLPTGKPKAFALFAHCFTCSKDLTASRAVATALTKAGIGVLRFDFTGLGNSGGDFASTNFSMNLGDLERAAQYLAENYQAPKLLVGHSLGGAAVIAVAAKLPYVEAVATIAAPSDVGHIKEQFGGDLQKIMEDGEAEVRLAERPFTIQKQFIEDLDAHNVQKSAHELRRPLLILHAPTDDTVGIENATRLFTSAKHPKSFVSLDTADHLLTNKADAVYAAEVIAAWARRYIGDGPTQAEGAEEEAMGVTVRETGQGKFQAMIKAGPHLMMADEPRSVPGGMGSAPNPYEYLCAALGACTTMTLRMYADFKKVPLDRVTVEVDHEKRHASDVEEAMDHTPKRDHFTRKITLEGNLDEQQRKRLLEIADRCPVHQTMERGSEVQTHHAT